METIRRCAVGSPAIAPSPESARPPEAGIRALDRDGRSPWGALSLRLGAVFVALLIAAAGAVGYLFDQGRAEALAQRDLEQLRLHAERGADELDRLLQRLAGDVRLLAQTPPIQGICRALSGAGRDVLGDSTLEQWTERLRHIFLVFAAARPDYLEIRLLRVQGDGAQSDVTELVGVVGQTAAPSQSPGGWVEGLDLEAALAAPLGAVHFGRLETDRALSGDQTPPRASLAAATPFREEGGDLVGLLLVRMDLAPAFVRARSIAEGAGVLAISDERGKLLLQPEPNTALSPDTLTPSQTANGFPGQKDPLAASPPPNGALIDVSGAGGGHLAYVTARGWDREDPSRRLIFVLSQPEANRSGSLDLLRRESLLWMGALLLLATLLVALLIHRQTRSLSALAGAAEAIAAGDFRVGLPPADGSEVGSLVRAFRHMTAEVKRREGALAALNRDLERRVEERTVELTRQGDLQRLILESVADGVVVTDRKGRFVLWNRKAEQIVGSGPDPVPPERWSAHFGVYRDESGEPLPTEDLPLVRAIHGESTDNTELYLHNPTQTEGRWTQVSARPLRDQSGGLSGAVAVLVDVTEKKRLQVRLQAHRAELRKFGRLFLGAEIASATAHQLSQPLGALCNYAGAAVRLHQQGRLSETELGEMLERIEHLSVQAGAILDRLRARIRRTGNAPTPFDVDRVVASCLDFLEQRIQREGVRVERHPGVALPQLLGDPIELEHALIQLVSNALEAMEEVERGRRRLTLATGHDPGAGLVTVEIADTGPGVSNALSDRLFQPWETDKPGALGIGLSIVQTIIESFGGRIRMESGVTEGALFRIELPLVKGGRG